MLGRPECVGCQQHGKLHLQILGGMGMDLGTGIAIVGIAIPTAAVTITAIKSKSNGNGNGKVCSLHGTLVEDIKEIKDDVKALIKEVAAMGR
jgi:hypothetical protein